MTQDFDHGVRIKQCLLAGWTGQNRNQEPDLDSLFDQWPDVRAQVLGCIGKAPETIGVLPRELLSQLRVAAQKDLRRPALGRNKRRIQTAALDFVVLAGKID